MVGHVALLLLMLVGAVTADDVTCRDVTPFTNFSMTQLTGKWVMASVFDFETYDRPAPQRTEFNQKFDNSAFVCQHFFQVNATNDSMEIAFREIGFNYLFEADEREGYFVDRVDKRRKLIFLGAERGKYFSFVICNPNSGNMDMVALLSRVGGLPENELFLIARGIDETLAFNKSLFRLADQSCWYDPAFPMNWHNIPAYNCSSLTSHHNVSVNNLSGDWVFMSEIVFRNGKPYNPRNDQFTSCVYMQNTKVTDERFNVSFIKTDEAGNPTELSAIFELEVDVTGRITKRNETNDISDEEQIVLDIDSGEFLAIVRCGPRSEDGERLVQHIDIVSRYGDKKPVISEDKLLQVEKSILDQLNINQTYVTPKRYNHTCSEHHVQLA